MIVIDKGTLQAVMPRVSGAKGASQARIVDAIAPVLQSTLERYEIATPLRIAHFLAQIAHESDGFCTTEEYASGRAYEGRRDLGNVQAGDGVRFKGRGLIQLTGRANYKTYGDRIGADLVGDPARAAEPATSLVLACEYWKAKGLNAFADQDDVRTITKKINGGYNGLEDRKAYLAKAKAALQRAAATLVATPAAAAPAAGAAAPKPVLRRDARGEAVKELQRALSAAGFACDDDGVFGGGTDTAVRAFQAARGLKPDGVVGNDTWKALAASALGAQATIVAQPIPGA